MKKTIAVFTALVLFALTFCFAVPAQAAQGTPSLRTPLGLNMGIEKLRLQFQFASAGDMDYNYFVPCRENEDSALYPLVIICSGAGDSYKDDQPVDRYYFANWSSLEFQRRFSGGGAYIMMPRASQDQGSLWYDNTVTTLKNCIDDFVQNHHVDPTRIYIAGFNLGARMVYQILDAYPNFFAAAVLMSPYTNASSEEARVMGALPVWFFGSSEDRIVSYSATYKSVWDEIINHQTNPAACRFSTFTYTVDPTGEKIWNNHETWHAFSCDMFFNVTENWPYCTTVDGTGKTVDVSYPNGVIAWFNTIARESADSSTDGSVRVTASAPIMAFFRRLAQILIRLFAN